jgi:tetratricopeptide (TPR) repeat protein
MTAYGAGSKQDEKALHAASKTKPLTSAQVSRQAVKKEKERAEDVKKNLNQKAVTAVAETYKVLELLDQNKTDEALSLLKQVIGELEVILAANEKAALIPVNSYHVVVDVELPHDQIRLKINEAKKMLNTGDVQGARLLLNALASEIDIIIEQLPLGTYPDAMKLASKYIMDGRIDEARSVLSIALNSMVVKTLVIPLPLVRAADLIEAASKTAKSDKEQANRYLEEAKRQLEIAKVLGYGKSDAKTYKDLEERIEAIQKEIKGKNKTEKMFEELMNRLKEFRKRLAGNS